MRIAYQVHGLRLLERVAVIIALFILLSPRTAVYGQEAAAIVNGQLITEDELNAAIRMQLDAINDQIAALKQTALNRLIDNLLVEQAAEAEGLSVETYLATHVERISVQEAEVNDAFEKSKAQLPATLAPEAKYRIRRSLEDARRADAMRSLLQDLRQHSQVRNLVLDRVSLKLDLKENEGPYLGSSTAPVTVVAFYDFECPFCRNAAPALRRAAEHWGDKLRIVFKNFPLEIHGNAFRAATAGYCAARDGHFWQFFDQVFTATTGLSKSELENLAGNIGLDRGRFNQCMDSPEALNAVQKDLEVGRAARIDGTPTIFVNRRKLTNVSELDSAIRQAMNVADAVRR